MNTENTKAPSTLDKVATADSKSVQGTSIGYAVNLVMDYGNGRQVTISGTLPLHATNDDFNAELDKLRVATNRQQSFIIVRDREARMAAEKKMVATLEHMLKSYDESSAEALKAYQEELDAELEAFSSTNEKGLTIKNQQLASMKAQGAENIRKFKENMRATRSAKEEELQRHKAEVEICEVIIAGAKKEIEG